ncbi:MAG: hypothetical protein M1818_002935 [Claussenomyces sp. TS43310]|nr:MAG: hypothetical protein M1818_002935 [Claussenomyces sp. TS43310]
MASSFEKSVKGATKIKLAPPKTKYIEHILIATHSGEHGVAEVFRSLQNRLRDSTWTVVFKSLITTHLMIREGSQDATLAYLAQHRNMLAISSFSDVQTQGRNIRHYSNYLTERARAYRETKCDWVRGGEHRLEKLSVEKGLLRETESVQQQIFALLKCDILDNELENEITITVFRMLVLDLLALFHVINQAMINILGHFFEMSKPDAERAMDIYRTFTKQTDQVVSYLSTARQYELQTRVEVPKLKHAPVNLGKQLEDYLSDPDFEINRRQYIAEQEAKKSGKGQGTGKLFSTNGKADTASRSAAAQRFPEAPNARPGGSKGPDPDLIDFFDSIEQNQQPMATQPSQQASMPNLTGASQYPGQGLQQYPSNGFLSQQAGFPSSISFQQQQQQQQQQPSRPPPFNDGFTTQNQAQVPQNQQSPQSQANYVGAGFGGYTPQSAFPQTPLSAIPQDNPAAISSQHTQSFHPISPLQQQSTNPFRMSMMASSQLPEQGFQSSASPPNITPVAPQSTNPFARSIPTHQTPSFPPPSNQQFQQQTNQQMTITKATPTGTNPFAKDQGLPTQQPAATGQLMSQPTGSTNPFRQSAFINTTTGSGWQTNQQGFLDHVETVPVFPRPAQQQPWQQ